MRKGAVSRKTNETAIEVEIDLDGSGEAKIATGVGFFDHMLDQLARHSLIDMTVRAKGDLHIDDHHTVEDVGIALGQALKQALGDKRGVTRYADCLLADGRGADPRRRRRLRAAVPGVSRRTFRRQKIGTFDIELVREFFQALRDEWRADACTSRRSTAPTAITSLNPAFKGVARALGAALAIDPRQAARIPSTKGAL